MTITSNPAASLFRRKTSRIKRLARFLWTAPPSFFVAAIPRRPTAKAFGWMKMVLYRL